MMSASLCQTTLDAFESIKPELGARQMMVLDILKCFGPMTNEEISKRLGWDINTVTPRVFELRGLSKSCPLPELVVLHGVKRSESTGRMAQVWVAK